MRKAITTALIGTSILLAACGNQSDPTTTEQPETTTTSSIPQTTTTQPAPSSTTQPTPSTTVAAAVVADTMVVTIEPTQWRVEPAAVLVAAPAGIELRVVNDTNGDQEIIFVHVFAGSPTDLPIVDGQVDVSRCNQIFGSEDDENPSPANFGCFGHLGEANPIEVIQLLAGETRPIDDGLPAGVYMVIDHQTGGYEQGRFVIFEVLDNEG